MKKSIFGKVGAAAVVLTLVTASLVGGTFAKYTSTATGEATATVAKWAIAMKANDTAPVNNKFDIALKNTNTDVVMTDGKIGPGASGTIEVVIDGTGSEVGYTYRVEADSSALEGVPLVFTKKDGTSVTISADADAPTEIEKGEVALEDVKTAKTITLNWKWNDASTDADDTTLGIAATVGKLNFKVTAEQLDKPTTPPAA